MAETKAETKAETTAFRFVTADCVFGDAQAIEEKCADARFALKKVMSLTTNECTPARRVSTMHAS